MRESVANPDTIAQLDRRFGLAGVASVVAGNGGLPMVRINTPQAAGEMYLHGAHVTSRKPVCAQEVLFLGEEWSMGRNRGPFDSPLRSSLRMAAKPNVATVPSDH